jgi:hypothetical protein
MTNMLEWKWHLYQCAFGVGLMRIATVWSDNSVPSFKIGDDTFELVTGLAEVALKHTGIEHRNELLSSEPGPDSD